MKTLYLALLFLFFIFRINLTAQSWQYCNILPSTVQQATFCGDSLFLVTSVNKGKGCPYYLLKIFDLEGELKWESGGGRQIRVSDTIIYVADYNPDASDVGINLPTIHKYDINGESIQDLYPEGMSTFHFGPPITMDVSATGKILICTSNGLVVIRDSAFSRTDKPEYERIFGKDTVLLGASFASPSFNDDFVIVFSNMIAIGTVSNGIKKDMIFPLGFEIDDHYIYDNSLYLLKDSIIFRWTGNEEDWDTIFVTNQIEVLDFKIQDKYLWVEGFEHEKLILISSFLKKYVNPKSTTYIIDNELIGKDADFYIKKDRIFLITHTPQDQAMILSFPLGQEPEINQANVALTDFDIEVTKLDWIDVGTPDEPYPYLEGYWFDASITIENTSATAINSVSFYTALAASGLFCYGGEYRWTEEDLNLSPGSTVVLIKEGLYKWGVNSDICFEALVPNRHIETDISDNKLCNYYPMSIENDRESEGLSVYPNPVKDELFIEFENTNKRLLTLYNSSGIMIFNLYSTGNELNIPMQDYASGIYYLIVSDQYIMISKKIEIYK